MSTNFKFSFYSSHFAHSCKLNNIVPCIAKLSVICLLKILTRFTRLLLQLYAILERNKNVVISFLIWDIRTCYLALIRRA